MKARHMLEADAAAPRRSQINTQRLGRPLLELLRRLVLILWSPHHEILEEEGKTGPKGPVSTYLSSRGYVQSLPHKCGRTAPKAQ